MERLQGLQLKQLSCKLFVFVEKRRPLTKSVPVLLICSRSAQHFPSCLGYTVYIFCPSPLLSGFVCAVLPCEHIMFHTVIFLKQKISSVASLSGSSARRHL